MAPGDTDFLMTAGTGIEAVNLPLVPLGFGKVKLSGDLVFQLQEFQVFLIAAAVVFGESPEIIPDQAEHGNKIQDLPVQEHVKNQGNRTDSHGKAAQLIRAVTAGHKHTNFFSHSFLFHGVAPVSALKLPVQDHFIYPEHI